MEQNLITQLSTTRIKLAEAAVNFVKVTNQATNEFSGSALEAGEVFVEETLEASGALGKEVQSAFKALRKNAKKEYGACRTALNKDRQAIRREALEAQKNLRTRTQTLVAEARPARVEQLILQAVRNVLERAFRKVDAQLAAVQTEEKADTTKRLGSRGTRGARRTKVVEAPLRNYDDLSARDVVARVKRLSAPKASAVLRYEKARKSRATVIRAAEQRAALAN